MANTTAQAKQTESKLEYTFFWSPEGQPVFTTTAITIEQAKATFKKACPQYAKFMGEVYWEVK